MDTQIAKEFEYAIKHDPNGPRKDIRRMFQNAAIIDVLVYREDVAIVIYKEDYDSARPYGGVSFGRINGVWKSLAFGLPIDDSPHDKQLSAPSVEDVTQRFERRKDIFWEAFVQMRNEVLKGRTASLNEKGGLSFGRDVESQGEKR